VKDSRKRILDSAMKLFLKRGFDVATLDEIAAGARLAKGTIYLYFKDKVDLYASLLEEKIQALNKGMAQIAAEKKPAREKLAAIVRFNLKFISEHYPGSHFILDTRAGQHPDVLRAIRTRIRPVLGQTILTIAEVVRQGVSERAFRPVDSFTIAVQIFSLTNIHLMIRALEEKAIDPERETEATLELVLQGIARK
jgi:AcrR family transcriptional regulator